MAADKVDPRAIGRFLRIKAISVGQANRVAAVRRNLPDCGRLLSGKVDPAAICRPEWVCRIRSSGTQQPRRAAVNILLRQQSSNIERRVVC